ncbi:MAG: cohesin domain-containing protein [Pseudomonadota bacterium]
MKRTVIVFAAAIMLLFGAEVFGAAVNLSFQPAIRTFSSGEAFTVDLSISGLGHYNAPSLSVFDLDVCFDPSVLLFSSAEFGPFLGDISQYEALACTLRPSDVRPDGSRIPQGVVNLFELSLLDPAELNELQPGEFNLAVLNFLALGEGDTGSLRVAHVSSLGDDEGGDLTPVPLPAAVIQFAGGLTGLGAFHRKWLRRR